MPTSTQSLKAILEQALLAKAAYADLSGIAFGDATTLISRLKNTGSEPMPGYAASYLAAQFGVLNQTSDASLGYSGTLFARLPTSGGVPSEFTMAFRGTDDGVDAGGSWTTDILWGIPSTTQLGRMSTQWTGLLSGAPGYALDPNVLASLQTASSTGAVNVTGHSLGGNLATYFSGVLQGAVSHASTFNSFTGVLPRGYDIPASLLSNYEGTSNPGYVHAFGRFYGSAPVSYFTEPSNNPFREHSMENLLMGIASRYLISLINSPVTDKDSNAILQAETSTGAQSFEAFAADLQRTFSISALDGEVDGDGTIFTLISAFEQGTRLSGSLTSLVGMSTDQVVSAAKGTSTGAAAMRFALVNQLPFAIDGAGATAYLGGTYAAANFSDDYLSSRAQYLQALFDAHTKDLTYSSTIEAGFVYRDLGLAVTLGNVALPDVNNSRQIVFGDNLLGDTITGGALADRLYGGGGNDILNGAGGNDVLDGGAGNDLLIGGAGVTTAAGGIGNDVYEYHTGDGLLSITDTQGADQISVNLSSGSYILGSDTVSQMSAGSNVWADSHGNRYTLSSDGVLSIALEDGGQIAVNSFTSGNFGINLGAPPTVTPPSGSQNFAVGAPNQVVANQTQTTEQANGWYRSSGADGGSWLSAGALFHTNTTEVITATAAVSNPANNQYAYAAVKAGMGDSYITGDGGTNVIYDDWVAHFDDAVPGIYGEYQMADQMGDDHIDAGGGNDIVVTRGGDDVVDGGAGDDILIDTHSGYEARFATNTSYLYSWASTEWVNQPGHSSDDQMSGGIGNDFIAAHGGKQTMDGGADNDELYAGAGNDQLSGGADNDVLGGDLYLTATPLLGTYDGFGNLMSIALDPNASLANDTVSYGSDILDGGAGNDTLFGGGGDDILKGGDGVDRMQGDTLFGYSDLRTGLQNIAADPTAIQGNDQLYGGSGDDQMWGGGGNDFMDGGANNDTMNGGDGTDVMYGGTGNDQMVADYTNLSQGDDELHGGDGTDTLYGMGGNDYLYGDAGDDVIAGGAGGTTTGSGDDHLEGGDGNDQLYGQDGNDTLTGGAGTDTVYGGSGDDRLIADSGNDVLFGDDGNDTFVLSAGSGGVTISDTSGINYLEFTGGITAADLRLVTQGSSLVLWYGTSDYVLLSRATLDTMNSITFAQDQSVGSTDQILDQIYKPAMLTNDPQNNPGYNQINLGTGVHASDIGYLAVNNDLLLTYGGSNPNWVDATDLTNRGALVSLKSGTDYGLAAGTQVLVLHNWYNSPRVDYLSILHDSAGAYTSFAADAVALPHTYTGTPGSDDYYGAAGADKLSGGAGDDLLFGDAGNDILAGGTGNDALLGSAGDDVYQFNVGDGADAIQEESGSDTLSFGAGITPGAVTVSQDGHDVLFTVGFNGDVVRVVNWAADDSNVVDHIAFQDGTNWNVIQVEQQIPGNHRPHAMSTLSDQTALRGHTLSYTVPSGTFVDANAGDTLTYSATLDSGAALPAWLTFNPTTRTFSGVPGDADRGQIQVNVIATDSGGLSSKTAFGILVPAAVTLNGTSGVDNLTATTIDDYVINGFAGNDTLTGGVGNDVLIGGAGADTYQQARGSGADVIQDTQTGHTQDSNVDRIVFDSSITQFDVDLSPSTANPLDLVVAVTGTGDSVTIKNYFATGTAQDRIERIELGDVIWQSADILAQAAAIRGTGGSDVLTAAAGGSIIKALAGNDTLNGGVGNDWLDGGSGVDTMTGGAGDDTYIVDNANDVVTEGANAGTDIVDSSATYTLAANVENLNLIGAGGSNGTGNSLANSLIGNWADNTLSGLAGNDNIDGGAGDDTLLGGDGNDFLHDGVGTNTLSGGDGSDSYFVNTASDTVVEGIGQVGDIDSITVDLDNYVLPANVEDLFLNSNYNIATASGNAGDNYIMELPGSNSRNNTLYGLGGNDTLDGEAGLDTLIGGTGDDNYIIDSTDGFIDTIVENVNEGYDWANIQNSLGVTYVAPTNVEGVISFGVGNNLTGNALDNELDGDDGNNILDGSTGADALYGYLGNDTFVVDNVGDTVFENPGEGTDTVQSSITYVLGADLENLVLTGSANINATGNGAANSLTGNSGSNVLDGGAGSDAMAGGLGNDTYVVNVAGDTVTENASAGTDAVQSAITYTLGSNVENLTLTGSNAINGTGNTLDNVLTGNSGNNTLTGLAGNDTLDAGSAGTDVLVGGTGNDTYIVGRTTGITITENASEGTDLVSSSVTYTLATNLENLTLTGTSAINGTGNAVANVITGNSGVNTLDGGTGADTLIGGAGNDIYTVDNTGDVVTESLNEGTDQVNASVTYTIGNNVENLTLGGSTAINGTGNTLDNALTGNTGNNTLTGLAGNDTLDAGTAGTDVLVGGTGNDTYIVGRSSGITITENGSEGTDLVNASVPTTFGHQSGEPDAYGLHGDQRDGQYGRQCADG